MKKGRHKSLPIHQKQNGAGAMKGRGELHMERAACEGDGLYLQVTQKRLVAGLGGKRARGGREEGSREEVRRGRIDTGKHTSVGTDKNGNDSARRKA